VTMDDYYQILGISQSASPDEIKKAYRTLVRKYHPDVAPLENKAEYEARFKACVDAYDTLSDSSKRAVYDQTQAGGSPFNDIFGSPFAWRNGAYARRGDNCVGNVFIQFEELLAPTMRDVKFYRENHCDSCAGRGIKFGAIKTGCTACKGTGVLVESRKGQGYEQRSQRHCPYCQGAGTVLNPNDKCDKCKGVGRISKEHLATVRVPAGLPPNTTLRLGGQGSVGFNGGPPGDLLIQVKAIDHPLFVRSEQNPADLFANVDVSFAQMCLGGTTVVQGLDKKQIQIDIGEYTPNHHLMKFTGHGLPLLNTTERGSLFVRLNVKVPNKLNENQKTMIRTLDQSLNDE
jgi:molecular chaperone DnaJ